MEETLPKLFEGKLKKMQLVSNNVCYGPPPEPNDEVEQHLTITDNGRMWLTRRSFGGFGSDGDIIAKLTSSIPVEITTEILDAISDYFSQETVADLATDVGTWELTLTNTEGKSYKVYGSLCFDADSPLSYLSDLIRKRLCMDNLFVFDGAPDGISKIDISYHRVTKIEPGTVPEGVDWHYVTWDYKEQLSIDRESEYIEHYREIGSGCTVKNIYHVEDGITSFLDGFDVDIFSEVEGNPSDVVDNPLETKDYVITVQTKHGDTRIIEGTFDKKGLPEDWEDFITDLFNFMTFYGFGQIFDPSIYGKVRRRESELIFCNVQFEDGGSTYCYLADSDDYDEGDLVVVKAGKDNHEAVVRVESIEYHEAADAPYPIEKIKHILHRYEKENQSGTVDQ